MPACSLTQKRLTLGLHEHLSKDRRIRKVTTGEMVFVIIARSDAKLPQLTASIHTKSSQEVSFSRELSPPPGSFCAAREKVKQMGLSLAEVFK